MRRALGLLVVAALLSACGSNPVRSPAAGHHAQPEGASSGSAAALPPLANSAEQDGFPAKSEIPPDIASVPDAVPRPEPRSNTGNPDSYEVYGDHYEVLKDGRGFKERGYASWYGKKFQGKRTSSGEPYDMFKMSAAHKTLPIPCYVRVTNLDNGKSVVVRVNDRGPFHSGRIIDLSYAAAVRLDLLGRGSTPVELVALDPNAPEPAVQVAAAPRPAPPAPAPVLTPVAAAAPPPARAPVVSLLPPPAPPPPPPPPVQASPPRLALASTIAAPPPVPAPPPAASAAAGRYLQTGSFQDPVNAATLRDQLNDLGIGNVTLKSDVRNGASVSRVLVGPFGDDGALAAVRKRLLDLRLPAVPVVE